MSEGGDEYIMCFRPTLFRGDSLRQGPEYCRYVRIEAGEGRELTRTGLLSVSIANILDEKLQPLSEMR